MKRPEKLGMETPLAFLAVLVIFLVGYISFMFYIEGDFVHAVASFGLTFVMAWLVLDRSVF